MAIKKLVPSTHLVLFKKAKKIITFDESLKHLLLDIEDTLYSEEASASSVSQIGVSQCVAMIDMEAKGLLQLINPEIRTESNKKVIDLEGSANPPNIFGEVERDRMMTVETNDLEGHETKLTAHDDVARMMLHIIDRSDSIPSTERVIGILAGREVETYFDDE